MQGRDELNSIPAGDMTSCKHLTALSLLLPECEKAPSAPACFPGLAGEDHLVTCAEAPCSRGGCAKVRALLVTGRQERGG